MVPYDALGHTRGFARRLARRIVDPTLLAVPVAAIAFFALRGHHLIAGLSDAAIVGLLGGGYVMSAVVTALCPPGEGGTKLYLRVSGEMVVIGSIVYAIGWGPTLALGLLFGVIDCTRTHGVRAARPASVAGVAVIAAGQGAIALGWVPTLVRQPLVHALAVLAVLGLVIAAELVRLAFLSTEEVQASLAANERRFKALVQHAADVIVVVEGGRFSYVSPAFHDILGYAPESLPALAGADLVHPEDGDPLARAVAGAGGGVTAVEVRLRTAQGHWRWFDARVTDLRADADVGGVVANLRDIDDRKRAEGALRASESSFRLLFASNPQPMWVHSRSSSRFLEVNDAAIDHYGYSRRDFLAMTIAEIRPPADHEALWESVTGPRPALQHGTVRHVRRDGGVIEVEMASHELRFEDEDAVLVAVTDVTERNALERQLRQQAERDELTGLANRALMRRRTQEALARARQLGTAVAVMQIDLDDFGQINDVFGHDAGDLVLTRAAAVLRDIVGVRGTVARTGSDEFAVLMGHVDGAVDGLAAMAGRMLDLLAEPIEIAGATISIEAAVGIALGPAVDEDATQLIQRAASALARSKRTLRRYEIDDVPAGHATRQRLAVIAELRHAIDHGQLRLHYQPKAELASGAVVGVEALVRWEHPDRGLIPPDDFVPLAERTGLIRPLTSFVLGRAVAQLADWRRAGLPVGMAVNLGVANLTDLDLPGEIEDLLARHGIPAGALTLEVTEVAAMTDVTSTAAVVAELSAIGVELSVDDFGTGHSSLAKLRSLPITEIKLDKSFVTSMLEQDDDATIVRSSVDLAHNLGLRVVAEGIESAAVAHALQRLGCDVGQGYWLSRPQDAAAMTQWLVTHPRGALGLRAGAAGHGGRPVLRAVPTKSA